MMEHKNHQCPSEHSYIEKALVLSTAHIPEESPNFGGLRALSFEYGYVVWVLDPKHGVPASLAEPGRGMPDWIVPVMHVASQNGCTFVVFDRDGNVDENFQTWDW